MDKRSITHPVERSHSFDEILNWFKENNVEFINSFPRSDLALEENENVFKNFFNNGAQANFLERFLTQISMVFSKPGAEGGLFLFLGKKN